MGRRVTGIFCVMMLLMTIVMYRIYYIDMSDYLTAAASLQSRYRLDVVSARGGVYDRNFTPLVNRSERYVASVLPTPQAATALLEHVPEESREALLERLSGAKPFVMEVADRDIYAQGVDIFPVPQRYDGENVAPHIIGYLDGEGIKGVAGVEKAFDALLDEQGAKVSAVYQVDAAGRAIQGGSVDIQRSAGDGKGGVVLTIDREIQLVTQNALAGWDKSAAVVMDVATGDVIAMASMPAFDQQDIAASLNSTDAPFINRAVSGYNIGSVFKLAVAAAALENNISRDYEYECKGYLEVGDHLFRCNMHAVHGVIDMQRALEVSCNTYFINLAQQLEPQYILALCRHMGLGGAVEPMPDMYTQPGNLPTSAELANPAALANFAFGQGSSLASPLQMAQVVSTIAGGGTAVFPRLVRGVTMDGKTFSETSPIYTTNRVLSERTAGALREMMVAVVEEGSGKPARPIQNGAGGKTSSAQTGQMDGDREIVHAWFAGFIPADKPRYGIVVFCEDGESGEKIAAPIFKRIADGIGGLGE